MSEIALYNLLRRIPDATDSEVEKAVADVASSKDVATKADIRDMATKTDIRDMATKADIAELKTDIAELKVEFKYLRWLIVLVVGVAVAFIKYL